MNIVKWTASIILLFFFASVSIAETPKTKIYYPNTQVSMPKTIMLGNTEWKLANQQENNDLLLAEYVTNGESIDHWTQLFTIQYFKFELRKDVTPEMFANAEMAPLKDQNYKLDYKKINLGPKEGMIEFRIEEPANEQQDEIQRINITPDTKLTVIHYVIKKADMGVDERKKWIKILNEFDMSKLTRQPASNAAAVTK